MRTRTLKLTIAYDGARYAGWQVQRHASVRQPPTIQAALEQTLKDNPEEIAPYKYLHAVTEAIEKVVEEKLKIFNNL